MVHYRLSADDRTVTGLQANVLARLPAIRRNAKPELLGMLQRGADVELYLGLVDLRAEAGNFEHHIEVFQGKTVAHAH